jgi:hypothetical protein
MSMVNLEAKDPPPASTKAGWRIDSWAADVEMSRMSVYNLLKAKRIQSVKIGKSRRITTTPSEFLASCPSAS